MIKAVIFDLDGVLIDTEKHFVQAWEEAAHFCGRTDFKREHGLMLRSLAAEYAEPKMKEIFGDDFPYAQIRQKRREIMEVMIMNHGVEKKPGSDAVIKELRRRGYRIAIATASDPERAKDYLSKAGLFAYFRSEEIICATNVPHGKPSPDVYEYACRYLGESPENCLAVEDSPNGIQAAFRAGMKVAMVPDQTEPDDQVKHMLTYTFSSLDKILETL